MRSVTVAALGAFMIASCSTAPRANTPRAQHDSISEYAQMQGLLDRALELAMPMSTSRGESVAVRVEQAKLPEEYYALTVQPGRDELVTAVLIQPDGQSINDQCIALSGNDGLSDEGLRSQLRIRRHEMTERTCPSIRTSFEALSRLPFSVLTREISLRSPHIDILVSVGGEWVRASYQSDGAIQRWALETLGEIKKCVKEP